MSSTPSVGDHLGNAGPLPGITFNGKQLKVAYPDLAVEAKVELAIAAEAVANAKELAAVAPDIVDYTTRLLAAREHRFGGSLYLSKMGTPEGQCLMLWACVSHVAGQESFSPADALAYVQANEVEAKLTLELVVTRFLERAAARLPLSPARQAELVAALRAKLATDSTP